VRAHAHDLRAEVGEAALADHLEAHGWEDAPLDAAVVREKFERLAARIADATGTQSLSAEATAGGFPRVAVENMANAIKKISVQRGYDVTVYTLNCFGGAGGQHACLVADALGMTSIFIHPFAGVLSAYGMGLADQRVLREKTLNVLLDEDAIARLHQEFSQLRQQGMESLQQQGVAPIFLLLQLFYFLILFLKELN